MISGKTEDGFEFEVDENIGKDFRIVMATKKLNAESLLEKVEGTYDFVEAVLGKSGIEKILSFTKEKKGYADTEYILNEAKEIVAYAVEQSNEVKKS